MTKNYSPLVFREPNVAGTKRRALVGSGMTAGLCVNCEVSHKLLDGYLSRFGCRRHPQVAFGRIVLWALGELNGVFAEAC